MRLIRTAAALAASLVSASTSASERLSDISSELAECSGVYTANSDVREQLGAPSAGEVFRGRGRLFGVAAYMLLLDDALEKNGKFSPVEYQDLVDRNASKGHLFAMDYFETEDIDSFNQSLRDCRALGEKHSSILDAALAGPSHQDNYGDAERWHNPRREYSALFPTKPNKLTATMEGVNAVAYQSAVKTDSGSAMYSITVTPIPPGGLGNGEKFFIENAHVAFVESLGPSDEDGTTSWGQFEKGSERLTYEMKYSADNVLFSTLGFWFVHDDTVIRVSVTYEDAMGYADRRIVRRFPNTFHLSGSDR